VTEVQPDRPQLAIVICVYELFAGGLSLAAVLLAYALLSITSRVPHIHTPWWSTLTTWLSIALSFAAALMLWRMHRSAFFIFSAKFLLGVGLFVFALLRPGIVTTAGSTIPNPPPQRTSPYNVIPPPHPQVVPLGAPYQRRNPPIDLSAARRIGYGFRIFFLVLGASFVLYTYMLLIKQKTLQLEAQISSPPPPQPRSSWPPPPQ
jgi:hypothetical protein